MLHEGRLVECVRVSACMIVIALALTACTSSAPSGSPTPTGVEPSGAPSSPVSMASARRCPVTIPIGNAPSARTYGNGRLRVGLWPHGVIAAGPAYVDARGQVEMKFPWWRTVDGRLRITGRRLDGPAPPLRSYIPRGYGA